MTTTTYQDYVYYINGDKLAILQRSNEIQLNPRISCGEDMFVTPTINDEAGIMLRYQPSIVAPSDEETNIGVSRQLARAIVCYVGARMYEEKDPRLSKSRMGEFYKLVQQEAKNLRPGMATGSTNYLGAIR